LCSAASPSFFEDFKAGWESRWISSTDPKYEGKFVTEAPEGLDKPALKVPEKAKHYGYATNLDTDVDPAKGLVLQYELKLSEGLTCGGAYLKFLTSSAEFDASGLKDDTPYTVMFGPDKCGSTNKVHLIIRHTSPDGEIEEKHLKSPPSVLQDSQTHVYTAILNPDNTYDVLIDGESKKAGSLFEDFEPPFNPPEEIDDPEDKKPADWVDTPRIPDPEAVKPDDWDEDAPREIEDEEAEKPEGWLDDEPAEIADPDASQPDDWDEEEDGEWEPSQVPNPKCVSGPGCGEWKRPKIPNPEYKGKWSAPLIDNPDYKGPWSPQKIANPKYFLDETPLKNIGKIGGVAIEIWTMDDGYFFDNILVANDPDAAEDAREKYWEPKKEIEDSIAAKKAEEAKAAAEAEGSEPRTLAERVIDVFDLPFLSFLKGPLTPALDYIEENEWAALPFALAFAGTPLLIIFSLLPKKKVKNAANATVRQVKKEDKPTPDDAKPATAATAEIVEEEEDEDDKKGVRRRARRD
jgi:calnexin